MARHSRVYRPWEPPRDNRIINRALTIPCDECKAPEGEYCNSEGVWVHLSRMQASGAFS